MRFVLRQPVSSVTSGILSPHKRLCGRLTSGLVRSVVNLQSTVPAHRALLPSAHVRYDVKLHQKQWSVRADGKLLYIFWTVHNDVNLRYSHSFLRLCSLFSPTAILRLSHLRHNVSLFLRVRDTKPVVTLPLQSSQTKPPHVAPCRMRHAHWPLLSASRRSSLTVSPQMHRLWNH